MKLYKVFAIALAALTLTACSDDDDLTTWNSASDVTVEMGQATVSVKEGKGLVFVPVKLNGTPNGNVQVIVETIETGNNPAKEQLAPGMPGYDKDVNYNYTFTSKTLILTPERPEANFEINIYDPENEINVDNYTFDIKIVSVKGASVGAQDFTSFTIKDNDADFYDKLTGNWKCEAVDMSGATKEISFRIIGFDEDEEGYGQYLIISGLNQYCDVQMDYSFDPATGVGGLSVPWNQVGGQINLSVGLSDVTLFGWNRDDGYLYSEGAFVGTWNETFNEIAFSDEGFDWGFLAVAPNGKLYTWGDANSRLTITSFTK